MGAQLQALHVHGEPAAQLADVLLRPLLLVVEDHHVDGLGLPGKLDEAEDELVDVHGVRVVVGELVVERMRELHADAEARDQVGVLGEAPGVLLPGERLPATADLGEDLLQAVGTVLVDEDVLVLEGHAVDPHRLEHGLDEDPRDEVQQEELPEGGKGDEDHAGDRGVALLQQRAHDLRAPLLAPQQDLQQSHHGALYGAEAVGHPRGQVLAPDGGHGPDQGHDEERGDEDEEEEHDDHGEEGDPRLPDSQQHCVQRPEDLHGADELHGPREPQDAEDREEGTDESLPQEPQGLQDPVLHGRERDHDDVEDQEVVLVDRHAAAQAPDDALQNEPRDEDRLSDPVGFHGLQIPSRVRGDGVRLEPHEDGVRKNDKETPPDEERAVVDPQEQQPDAATLHGGPLGGGLLGVELLVQLRLGKAVVPHEGLHDAGFRVLLRGGRGRELAAQQRGSRVLQLRLDAALPEDVEEAARP
mmetsp:Transcript_53074/g.164462  ORF Transcript_53074/g.164462 Transcript_53074/m.164462 type:complete len:472 (-) Transcript_53074:127-1542(-)